MDSTGRGLFVPMWLCLFASTLLLRLVGERSVVTVHRKTQTAPHDSPWTLVFDAKKLFEVITGSPPRVRQMQVGYIKVNEFRQITRRIS